MQNNRNQPKYVKLGVSNTLDAWLRNLANTGRVRKQLLSAVFDGSLAVLALWCAYTLRHGMPFSDFRASWHVFVMAPIVVTLVFGALGIYRWVIRSANERLLTQLVKGCVLAALAMIVFVYFFPADRSNPRSLFVIFGLLLFAGTFGARVVWRSLLHDSRKGEPIAIYGAGNAGQRLASLLRAGDEFHPVMFIDDDPRLVNNLVMGLPVVRGDSELLAERLLRAEAARIVLAMPSVSTRVYQEKLDLLKDIGLPVQTMPSISELMSNKAKISEIRDISIRDILGRNEVVPNVELMGRRVRHRAVLVTGGGGSIGSELCRQIAGLEPLKLVILDNGEANLYQITEELTPLAASRGFEFVPILGSVTDADIIRQVFAEHAINTVYHAAAYKHVPIIERQPDQGVRVNVFGTRCVLDMAVESGVEDFVLVSTDKAVRPTNAMGASKRLAELVLQAKATEAHGTRISMVRFGNVLGSSGSVVPKFRKQILSGGPVTLTHPEITRFFMTIPEASQLVLQASAIARGGEVFVLDMGESVRILELAKTMIRLYGKKVGRDTTGNDEVEIVFTGLRPGEKMYEELFVSDDHRATEVSKIFCAEEHALSGEVLESKLVEIEQLCRSHEHERLLRKLKELANVTGRPAVSTAETKGSVVAAAGQEERSLAMVSAQ